MMRRRPADDHDTAWKEMLQRYFQPFIEFFFLGVAQQITWERGVEFLDKELNQAVRQAGRGRHIVDKLAKVWLRNGTQACVLAHVEVQSQAVAAFARRTYLCNSLLQAREQKLVASLIVLADPDPLWRPDRYSYELFGYQIEARFPVVKLTDYRERWDELTESPNPFAVVAMAHLRSLDSKRKAKSRLGWKEELAILMHQRGQLADEITDLLRFLDLVMPLPADLQREFERDVVRFESEQSMPVMGQWEKRVARQSAVEMVIAALEERFPDAPLILQHRIRQMDDPRKLKSLLITVVRAHSVQDVEQALA